MAIRDLLLKIAGDGDDAKRELAAVAKEAAEFARQEYEAIADVDTTPAENALERAKRELREYGRISVAAAAGVEIAKAEAQLQRITTRLENLDRQEASPRVDAATTQALLQLDRVQARLDKLKAARVEIELEVAAAGGDVAGDALEFDIDPSAASALSSITSAISGLFSALGSGGGGGGLLGATTAISAGFVHFGSVSGPLVAILAVLAVTIGVSLVGALAALVASLAAAAAAAGALAIALAGALGPVLAVVVAAVARFTKVIQAFKAQSAATQQAQQQAAAGSAAVTAAAEQQETAARALADANERLGQATKQAYDEMADAAEAASDAVRAVAEAEDDRAQASIDTRNAIAQLEELRGELGATGKSFTDVFEKFTNVNVDVSGLRSALGAANASSGGRLADTDELKLEQAILNVRKARNAEKKAIDGVSDAETNRTRTQQRANEFAREGIGASEGYAAALRGVADAQRQVNSAAEQQGIAAAQAKAQVLVEDLTDAERTLLGAITAVGAALKTAFGPATDAIMLGVAGALGNIAKLATALKPAFTGIGGAIASALVAFSGELVKPEWIAALTTLADGGTQLIGIFTADLFIPFLEILRDVAVAALPFLIVGLEKFGVLLRGLSSDASAASLAELIGSLVPHLESWLSLIGAIALVMLAFFKTAAPFGKALVDDMAKLAREFARWLGTTEGLDEVEHFFKRTIPTAVSFAKTIVEVAIAFIKFGVAAAPVVKIILDILTFILRVNDAFFQTRSTVLGFVKDFVAARVGPAVQQALGVVSGQVDRVRDAIERGKRKIAELQQTARDVREAFRTAWENVKEDVRSATGTIRDEFNGFVNDAKRIGRKIGDGIVSGINTALRAVEGIGKALGNVLIDGVNAAIALLNKIHFKVPDWVPKTFGGGKTFGFSIDPIQRLAEGGITNGRTFAEIGEAGREAVLPLTRSVLGGLAAAIWAQMRLALPAASGLPRLAFADGAAGGGGRGTHIEHQEIVLRTPGGAVPDARFVAVQLMDEMARGS